MKGRKTSSKTEKKMDVKIKINHSGEVVRNGVERKWMSIVSSDGISRVENPNSAQVLV